MNRVFEGLLTAVPKCGEASSLVRSVASLHQFSSTCDLNVKLIDFFA